MPRFCALTMSWALRASSGCRVARRGQMAPMSPCRLKNCSPVTAHESHAGTMRRDRRGSGNCSRWIASPSCRKLACCPTGCFGLNRMKRNFTRLRVIPDRRRHACRPMIWRRSRDGAKPQATMTFQNLRAPVAEAGVDSGDLLADAHAFVAKTPCAIMLVQADDLSEETEPLNVPGTDKERANWRRRLSVTVDELPELGTSKRVMAAIQNTERGKTACFRRPHRARHRGQVWRPWGTCRQ